MGDGAQILKWTLAAVHSYWLKQTLQGEKVAFKVRKDFQSDKQTKKYKQQTVRLCCAKSTKEMMQEDSAKSEM